MKLTLFLILFLSINSQEEYKLITAKFYSASNTIEFNDKKYVLSLPEDKIQKTIPYIDLGEPNRAVFLSSSFWFNLIMFLILVCFACTMNALKVIYLSIDSLVLEIKMNNGTESEKNSAKKIYELVQNYNLFLVTLLLCYNFACLTMPFFLSKLINEMTAIIIGIIILIIFGEIVPQTYFTGPNQMKIASFLFPFTNLLMRSIYPISYPISLFMDSTIGDQRKNKDYKSDLRVLMELEMKEKMVDSINNKGNNIIDILSKKTIEELIVPIEKVIKIDYQEKLTKNLINMLIKKGFSQIPVYKNNKNNLISILNIKELVGKNLSKQETLEQLEIPLIRPVKVYEDELFFDLFEKFRGKTHMAFIYQKKNNTNYFESTDNQNDQSKTNENNLKENKIKGIITLNDLFEYWMRLPMLIEEKDEEDY